MSTTVTPAAIPVASRVHGFSYAIRNIVAEAKKVEATGRKVRYLNIGDPIPFGFQTPAHLIEAVEKAMRDGHNGYGPSPGIMTAREAVADDFTAPRRAHDGRPRRADGGHVRRHRDRPQRPGRTPATRCWCRCPTYPLYTAVTAKIAAKTVYYRTDPAQRLDAGPRPDPLAHHAEDARARRDRPEQPDRRHLSRVDPPRTHRARVGHGFVLLADEVYGDLAYDGPTPPMARLDTDAPVVSFGSLSKAYLAPGWRAGWMAVGASPRLDRCAGGRLKLADGRLCATVPMQYAITAALRGDRSHQVSFRQALRERAELTVVAPERHPGHVVRGADGRLLRDAEGRPAARADRRRLRARAAPRRPACCASTAPGFGTKPEDGFFRVVFLASPAELAGIYDTMAEFTAGYLGR